MKNIIAFSFLFLTTFSFGQVFHFVDSTTTLVKNTTQSPAHWYIEIYSDISVDTTLRWKASFSNIPTQWTIELDDQTNYTTNIQHGDSADFILSTGLAFPQKLIIGVILNNTPATGSVYFDIYDPNNPSVVHRIEYHMIVTQATSNLIEVNKDLDIQQKGNTFIFSSQDYDKNIKIYSLEGKEIYSGAVPQKEFIVENLHNQFVYFVIEGEDKIQSKKFYIH